MLYINDKIYITGLTGMSGAGKTTACRVFAENGFAVIDCDNVARRVVEKGRPALRDIAGHFTEDILTADGELDRGKLGGIVFGDREKLDTLNDIIYPYITYFIVDKMTQLEKNGSELILLDAPTLFESGADKLCDVIVSVTADRASCAERIMSRDGLTAEQAENRLSSQHDAGFYRERSDYCAENTGTAEEFSAKIADIARSIASGRRGD